MIKKLIYLLFVLEFMLLSEVFAAEIYARPQAMDSEAYLGVFAIEGDIKKGDFEKFEDIVKSYGHAYNSVLIASKGGDVMEAMKIGLLIRRLALSTSVPSQASSFHFKVKDKTNLVCASSCFFIYAAGVSRSGDVIGLHRPFFSDAVYQEMAVEDVVVTHRKLKGIISNYLSDMSVPPSYLERIWAYSKDEIDWLKPSEINRDLNGFIPGMEEWLNANCDSFTEIERATKESIKHKAYDKWSQSENDIMDALRKKEIQIMDCKLDNLKEVACEKWATHFNYTKYNPCKLES